jgi:hypothetical protein
MSYRSRGSTVPWSEEAAKDDHVRIDRLSADRGQCAVDQRGLLEAGISLTTAPSSTTYFAWNTPPTSEGSLESSTWPVELWFCATAMPSNVTPLSHLKLNTSELKLVGAAEAVFAKSAAEMRTVPINTAVSSSVRTAHWDGDHASM